MTVFSNDDDGKVYLQFMAEETSRFGVAVLAWCRMSNHTFLLEFLEMKERWPRLLGKLIDGTPG